MTASSQAAAALARALSVRLRAGDSLVEALDRCAQSCPAWKSDLLRVAARARSGDTLAEALQAQCSLPVPLARLLACGAAGEQMTSALDQAACLLEESAERRARARMALAYPQMVAILFLVMACIVSLYVVPDLRAQYEGMHLRLPTLTWVLFSLASPSITLTGSALALLVLLACQSRWAGAWGEEVRLRLPLLGSWMQRQNMVIWLSWMDLLLQRGLPVDEAVVAASEPCPSSAFRNGMARVSKMVARGTPLSQALSCEATCPDLGAWLVAQAETVEFCAGRLAKASDVLRRDVDVTTSCGIGVLEPASMLALGLASLLVVASVLLPLFQLVGGLS